MKRLLTCLFALFTIGINAQTEEPFEEASRRMYDFYATHPIEKVYLHQDRTHYVAGETMWFKAYQWSNLWNVKSGVLYVELVNGNNELMVETKWPLLKGTISGHIDLPDTLTMGVYQIRAYTHWMQNLYPDGYYTNEITVSSRYAAPLEIETDFRVENNLLHAALRLTPVPQEKVTYSLLLNGEETKKYPMEVDEDGEVLLEIELPKKKTFEGPQYFVVETGEESRKFPIPFAPAVQLYLFPEGGNLVAGIPSRVAFKVTDRIGNGLEASGTVTDETGRVVNTFQTTHQGNGAFYFQPEAGHSYTARLDHKAVQTALPEAYANGVVMQMKHWENNMRVTVQSRIDTQTFPLLLTIHQEGISWYNAYIEQKEEDANVIDIPIDKLPSGIFTVTVYDRHNHAWCERLAFFNYPEALNLQLKSDKTNYSRREKVTLTLDSPTDDLEYGNYSFAVVKAGLDPIAERNNLYTDYFLQSEIKGRIENPAAYLSNRAMEGWHNLDLLLLTQGWRKYDWERMMTDKVIEPNYPMEESLTFSGKVHLQNKRQKLENITMNAAFRHPEIDDIQSFHPGEGGVFKFVGYNFRDTAEVILSASDKKQHIMDISIFDHVSLPPNYFRYGKGINKADNDLLFVEMSGESFQHVAKDIDKTIFELPEVAVTAKKKSKQIMTRRLHSEALIRPASIVNKTRSYGGNMLNLLYLVPGLQVKETSDGGWSIKVLGTSGVYPAVFILNGTATSKEVIEILPPSLVERIEVLNPTTAMIYSRDAAGGGVAFYTNSYMEDDEPTKTVMHQFIGYNQKKEFFSPNYAVPNTKGYQDFDRRNTLYWQPEVSINEQGKAEVSFFTSDEKGEYLIHCEGRSSEGVIGVSRQTFTVE